MRGEASRIADRESRDSLAPKLRDTREDAWRIGNELFTITKVLDDSIQLERALTDPSRPVADKVAVLKELLGDNAHPMTMEIMTDLVSRRWSRARDIANAVEDFGVDAMMYYADATDATLQVSIELSELHSALLNLPVVRAKLYDYQATSEARVKLFREVFSGKTLNKVTMRLAEHATCNLRRRRYLETIQWLINKGVDAIWYPDVPYERNEFPDANNNYNCPIVTSYAENIKNNVDEISSGKMRFLNPFVALSSEEIMTDQLIKYLAVEMPEIPEEEIRRAAHAGWLEMDRARRYPQKGRGSSRLSSEKQAAGHCSRRPSLPCRS